VLFFIFEGVFMNGPDNEVRESSFRDKEIVTSKDYVAVEADSGRCVDERKDREGQNRGVQFPGGALHILDLMRVAITKNGKEIGEDILWEMTDKIMSSEEAQKHNIRPGVHIDDDHGNITSEEELEDRLLGCGYDSVRSQVMGRLGVDIGEYEPGENIRRARERGWGVQQLTGAHSNDATAALNYLHGMTLDNQKLWEEGRVPSFNHDIWAVRQLIPAMERELKNGEFEGASRLVKEHGVNWSKQIYIDTLDILSQGRIGEQHFVEITS
jgi:hypothetical protein